MATIFETPAQYDRDLRSANKEWKRGKTSTVKWSHGSRPLSGCGLDWVSGEAVGGSDSQRAKARPRGKWSEQSNNSAWKNQQNVNKLTHGHHRSHAGGRVRTKMSVREEIDDASAANYRPIAELLPSLAGAGAGASETVLYSFDRADSPDRPVTLDVFVKPATARETERLVEREYEILDEHGDALRGRKARQTLRKAAGGGEGGGAGAGDAEQQGEAYEEEDGFELI